MDKLKVPQTPMVNSEGRVTPHWERFFEAIAKFMRTADLSEIGTGEPEQNGNWRMVQSGDDLVIQKKESGSWNTKQTYTP